MECLVCQKNEAQTHPSLGVLPCVPCQDKDQKIEKPKRGREFTTNAIKESRKEYAKDTVQPFRGGVVSKEYIDLYGSESLGVSKQDIKNARNVWGDVDNIKNISKSKGGKDELSNKRL